MDQTGNYTNCNTGNAAIGVNSASSLNLNFIGPCRDNFKPKAYVNPNIVRCASSLPNTNVQMFKNIHINPNFKGASVNFNRTYLKSQFIKDKTSVHVNPYFHPPKANNELVPRISGSEKLDDASVKVQMWKNTGVMDETTNNLPTNINNFVGSSTSKTFFNSTSNPSYSWSNSNSKNVCAMQTSHQGSHIVGTMPVTKSSETSRIKEGLNFLSNHSIKTRHKIVNRTTSIQGDNTSIGGIVKSKSTNCYKIVNNGKTKFDCNLKQKVLPALNKDLFYNSRNIYTKIVKKDANPSANLLPPQNNVHLNNSQSVKLKSFHKKSPFITLKNKISTKYSYTNKKLLHKKKALKLPCLNSTKYKLDKRKPSILGTGRKDSMKMTYDIRALFPKKVLKYKLPQQSINCWTKNKFKLSNHPVWGNHVQSHAKTRICNVYQNKTVVNIGGIMYKSTTNKLTRTGNKKLTSQLKISNFTSKLNQLKKPTKKHHIVYVRGEKFSLEDNGKTLIRQPSTINRGDNKYIMRRVDIGGVTYIQKSKNVLIRTNTHQARHLVNQAKQKSIAVLQNLHKRNNMPCMIYNKFGRCARHDKGLCIYVHDLKNIAVCKKFLKGECEKSSGCLLTHNVVKEKMATCHFFLMGNCNRENCPFLHVKVNTKADICINFLQGYCALSSNCKKRHVYLCPDFESKGACSRQSKCPYPHTLKNVSTNMKKGTSRMNKEASANKREKKEIIFDKASDTEPIAKETVSSKRNSKGRITKRGNIIDEKTLDYENMVECIPKRIKLDHLPIFIPLDTK